ncbi:uncharacterized protein LOC121616630 [Chelmon rostratus]|uniref:uncharacterized protein LOC121616630 n=1 Tax=Chelmon rostratus TaxID=109905 RepID=UPI001BE69762|nr:uncharacterized protein LOC121616630 [Chelmon rostratus]
MVIMFRRNQAALLSVQLLALCQVFAGIVRDELKNMQVFRGDSVQFTCNTSGANIRQIDWTKVSRTKGRLVFSHSISTNQTFSNWTSHRLIIDLNLPPKLNIFNAQHDDAGLYTCTVIAAAGTETFQWNLTLSEKPEEISPSWILQYILAPVIGLLLCAVAPAVCLCRKSQTKTPNQDRVRRGTLSYVHFRLWLGEEVAPLQPWSCVEYRVDHKQREAVPREALA